MPFSEVRIYVVEACSLWESAWTIKYSYLVFVYCSNLLFPDNRHQEAKVPVAIRVLDVNDNAPKFAAPYEGFICESDHPKPLSNQVRLASPIVAIKAMILK